jgi:[acyl-carrier-protein] S-malonyltransferase
MSAALIFPGQGSQRQGMLDALPQTHELSGLLDLAQDLSGIDLRAEAATGAPERLADTRVAQPLLYLADWAWGSAAIAAGIAPSAVAGHSLGEFAALALAGAFPVGVGLELVVERSRLMAHAAAATPGGMSAVLGLDAADIAAVTDAIPGVWVANDNAPGQVVISGTAEGIAAATAGLAAAGARRIVPLNVSGPFHTVLMQPAADAFARLLEQIEFTDTPFPVYSNTDPRATCDATTLKSRLSVQITEPVRWTETMRALVAAGHNVALECGTGTILTGLTKRVDGLTGIAVEQDGIAAVIEQGESS